MACEINIIINGQVQGTVHSDEELDAWIIEHQATLSNALASGTGKIFSFSSLDETYNKLTELLKKGERMHAVREQTGQPGQGMVSIGIWPLFSEFGRYGQYGSGIERDIDPDKVFIKKPNTIDPKLVGTEANNVVDALIQGKSVPAMTTVSENVAISLRNEITKQNGFLDKLYRRYNVTDPKKQVFCQCRVFTQSLGNPLTKELAQSAKQLNKAGIIANQVNTVEAIPDLIIIDDKGVLHIIDIKTTSQDTSKWLTTKNDYVAQIASYREIYRQLGFNVGDAALYTLKTDYNRDADGSIINVNSITVGDFIPIPTTHKYVQVARDFFWLAPEVKDTTLGQLTNLLGELFPQSEVGNELVPTEIDYDFIKDNVIKKVKEGSKAYQQGYRYVFYQKGRVIGSRFDVPVYGKTLSDLTEDKLDAEGKLQKAPLKSYVEKLNIKKQQRFLDFGKDLKHAMDDRSVEEFENTVDFIAPKNKNTLVHTFKRYIQCGWNFQENEKLNANGIYLFSKGERLEIVVIDEGHAINREVKLPLGTSILGTYLRDSTLTDTRTIMKATYGNLMLLKAVALIALDSKLTENKKISSIRALNLHQSQVYDEDNSRLIENWNQLAFRYKESTGKSIRSLGYNTFMNDADALCNIADEYIGILTMMSSKNGNWQNIEITQKNMTEDLIMRKINSLRNNYEALRDFRGKEYGRPEWDALAYLERALLAVRGFHIFQEKDLGKIFNGIALTGIDMRSFGSSTSPLARQAAELMSYTRTAIRLKFLEDQRQWSRLIDAAMKEEGWTGGLGNDWRFFEKWFKHDSNGKIDESFRLVDPADLNAGPASKKALEFLLETNAKYRWPNKSLEDAKQEDAYYEMPLFVPESFEQLAGEGPWQVFKTKWNKLKNVGIELALGKEVDEKTRKELESMPLNLPNVAWGDESERQRLLEKYGPMHYERNLDKLMLSIIATGAKAETGSRYCEFFTAFMVVADYMQKNEGLDIDNIRGALEKFIQSKLYGKDIKDPENRTINAILGFFKSFTASVALGWNTRALFREGLTGIKKHFNRFISGLDKQERYGRPHFIDEDAFAEAYMDVMGRMASKNGEYSNFSIFSFYHQLNSIYGMVNFSYEEMADASKRNQWTVFGFLNDKSMSTATAPDFLHRMAILGGHLRTIGAWDAYYLDKDGNLQYDMTKDERYKLYLQYKDNEDSIPDLKTRREYTQQKENYLRAIRSWQIVDKSIKEGDLLPQALSPQETLNVKQFADDLYGNYDEETKSIVQKQTLGSLFFQYKTYGLAQFAQWFAEPGYTNTLAWVNVVDKNGEKIVKVPVYSSDGFVVHGEFEEKPESEVTEEEWKKGAFYWVQLSGNEFTGKLQTDYLLMTHLFTMDSKEFNDFWNDHPLYRSQLYMTMLDLFELMLISLLLRLFWDTKEEPIYKQDFLARWTYGVLSGAAEDGPLFQTFQAIVGDGTPPVLGMLQNYVRTANSVIAGNNNILYGLTNTLGTTRELSNLFREL